MAEQVATPPVDVAAIVKQVTDQVTQAFGQQVAELANNLKVVGDTVAAQKPLDAAAVKAMVAEATAGLGKGVDAGAIKALVGDALAGERQAAAKTAARQKVIDDLKAKGVADELLTHVPDTDDAEKLRVGAEKAIARWNEIGPKAPDVGGDGKGTPPATDGSGFLKMPA